MSLYLAKNLTNFPSIGQFLFKEIGHLHHFIGKSPRGRANHFQCILEYPLMPIIVPKQILLMSLYFGENLPNFPSIVQFLFKEIGHLHHFIGKSPRGRANHFPEY